MSYDNTSFYGDLICNEYDEQNNFINPESPLGFYIYHILGDSFDIMSEQCTKFMNDTSILTADVRSLDKFWGISYNMPRPKLESGRELTDEEYRIYLYLRNCRLITREDLEICMGNCFNIDDYKLYFTEESVYLRTVDHTKYESNINISSNLQKNQSDSTRNYITDFENDDDVFTLEGLQSENAERFIIVNIPFNNYDSEFLTFMEQFISLKGNVLIREFVL